MPEARDWRVGHQGRDMMYYEERIAGVWERIAISGEMLTGRAHHVIYFSSPAEWQQYPAWARARRDEIVARIKSEFTPPDYEYHEPQAPSTASATATPVTATIPTPTRRTTHDSASSSRALLLALALLVTLAAGMGWLVARGITRGETHAPVTRGSLRRPIVRSAEPAMFWASVGLYAIVGVGAAGLAVWGFRVGRPGHPASPGTARTH